jgi:tRNA(Arg) A34 adenosine deaminase TadA
VAGEFIAQDVLQKLVGDADRVALDNVRARRGGPFGALLYVGDVNSGEVVPVGIPAGNAVLATGLATAHAEDQLLSEANIEALRAALGKRGRENSFALFVSSAESCPACHAKLEVFARLLVHDGLLLPGRFIFAYGASYADTRDVAGFNDDLYHEDFMKSSGARLVTVKKSALAACPEKVRGLFGGAVGAVLALPGSRLFAARDERQTHFTLIPEIAAVNAACAWQKEQGIDRPWDLNGATLYSYTFDPGPMAYAACQWANVKHWVVVGGGAGAQETPDAANAALFRAVAQRPYNGPGTAVHIVRAQPFANMAQFEWKKLLGSHEEGIENYNGIGSERD